MAHSPDGRLEAASRHEDAAVSHERSAKCWDKQGDADRAALQREVADYERRGVELERRWAALIVGDAAAGA